MGCRVLCGRGRGPWLVTSAAHRTESESGSEARCEMMLRTAEKGGDRVDKEMDDGEEYSETRRCVENGEGARKYDVVVVVCSV